METGAIEFRPLTKPASWSVRLAAAVPGLIAAFAFAARFGLVGGALVILGGALLVVPLAVYTRIWRKRARITLDGTRLTFAEVRNTKVLDAQGGRIYRFRRRSTGGDAWWLLVDQSKTAQLQLNCRAWGEAQLAALEQRLGLPVETLEEPLSLKQQGARFPQSTPWGFTHAVGIGVALVIGVVVIVAVATG